MSASTVSGTIQDPSGQIFANGTWQLVFKPTPNTPGTFTDGGTAFTRLFGGSLDAAGSFSQAGVARNDTIAPAGSKWSLIVSPNANGQAYSVDLNVNNAAFNVSAAINAVITNVTVQATSVAHAYKDSEVIPVPGSGGLYFDVTLKVLKLWDIVNQAWITVTSANPVTIPTGTGFFHVTGGVEDPASKLVDVSSADITGVLKASAFPALTGDITSVAGALATTLATVATPGTSPKVTFNAKGLVTSGTILASGDIPNNAANTSGSAAVVISATANPAAAGVARLASSDTINFRNNANNADLTIAKTGATSGLVLADTLNLASFAGALFAGPLWGLNSIATDTTHPISIPAVTDTLAVLAAAQTLTTKRITPRQIAMADATSVTPTSDTADINTFVSTQAGGTLTVNAPSGTPTDGQKLTLRLKSTNAQTYSFNATYAFSTTVTAPTTLAAGKTDYIGLMWNATNTKWDVVAVDQGH